MADAAVEVEDRLIGEDDGEAGDGVGGRADPAAAVNIIKLFFLCHLISGFTVTFFRLTSYFRVRPEASHRGEPSKVLH
jgi:hypothetical protein